MAYVVIAICFGIAGGMVGRKKGSSFLIWFLVSACVPFIGLATAFLYRWDKDELRRECPGCGRIVKLHDALCTSCGTELDFPDVAIAPESQIGRNVPVAGGEFAAVAANSTGRLAVRPAIEGKGGERACVQSTH